MQKSIIINMRIILLVSYDFLSSQRSSILQSDRTFTNITILQLRNR